MNGATVRARKAFAVELAERDGVSVRYRAAVLEGAQSRAPSDSMMLLARASVARRLVKQGVLDCADALAFAVWPSPAVLEREAHVGYGTLTGRAFGKRGNL